MSSYLNNKDLPGILTISDPEHPPELNEVKKRCLILSPTVNAGLEPESKLSDFEKEREIGKGGFGLVWKVIHKKTKKIYCIKVIQKQGIMEQKLVDQMNREIEIMYILNNPHCLRLKNHFEDDNNFYLVMPLATKGQLYRILRKFKRFDERTAAQILRETISALQYLHSFHPPIIHRDIKPENLLLNEGGRVLLADYGWSNFKNDGDVRKTFCGTPEYIAPEMLLKKGHDTRVDIWSIGVLMFELLTGSSPFYAKNNQELYQNIRKLKINWPRDMSPMAKNLISKILKLNPDDRPSFDEILNHQWFKHIQMIKPLLENKYKSLKDLLVFHMLNGADDQKLERINKLLKLSGKDADNTNAKDILENEHVKEEVTKKKVIVNDIQKIQNKNHSNTVTGNKGFNSNKNKRPKDKNGILADENDNLRVENEDFKNKLKAIENELKNLKNENKKLKEEKNSTLQDEVKNKDIEIDKLKVMNKDRIAVLAELEQKSNLSIELNKKIQMLLNESEQKDKSIENSQQKIKEINKQLETKDIILNDMRKKNLSLEQEKEKLFIDYQKKIEELQLEVLDRGMDSTEGLCKVIDILNSNVDEFKNIFKKKIDKFEDEFDTFKSEYNKRDESFTFLVNDKTKDFNDLVTKFMENIRNSVNKVFTNANNPTSNIKDKKIEFLNKQVNELSGYKNKTIEYENKVKELTNKSNNAQNKYKEITNNIDEYKKQLDVKNQKLAVMKKENDDIEKKLNDMKAFMDKNFSKEIKNAYMQQSAS